AELPKAVFLKLSAQPAARHEISLGTPRATRFTAAYRNEPFWMRPAVCSHAAEIPVETQLLFARLPGQRVALFVPLVDGKLRCSLQGASSRGTGELLLIA